MKRPLFIAAAAVLSGIICGINETSLIIKLAAVSAAAVGACLESGVFRNYTPLFRSPPMEADRRKTTAAVMAAGLLLFALGFARGAFASAAYAVPECRSFFEAYEPTNPGQFDYASYLKANGISSREEYEAFRGNAAGREYGDKGDTAGTASGTGSPEESPLLRAAEIVRDHCGRLLDEKLDSHDAGIYRAVLLGEKSEMDSGVRSMYQSAGIAHLLSVSGLHVGMIGAFVYGLLRRKLSGRRASVITSLFLLFYMLMAGSSGSVIRAVIMLIISFAAANEGRRYDVRSSVCAAAVIIMMWRPYMIFTSGFQLSFGAVAAISFAGNAVLGRLGLMIENRGRSAAHCKRVRRQNRPGVLLSTLVISASVQLVTLPITAFHYFVFPTYGILLNLIVIPLMGCVLCSGFGVMAAAAAERLVYGLIMLLTGSLSELCSLLPVMAGMSERISDLGAVMLSAAGKAFSIPVIAAAAPGHYILKLYEQLCFMSMRLPFASLCLGRPGIIRVLVYYIILAAGTAAVLKRGIRRKYEVYIRSVLILLVSAAAACVLKVPDPVGCRVTVLDVGQGDCSLVRCGDTAILIDGGSSDSREVGERIIEPCLKSKGIDRLDMIIVSHCDNDHINGIEYILGQESGIRAEVLVLPPAAEKDEAYSGLKEAAERNDIPTIFMSEGPLLTAPEDRFSLYCLYPGIESSDTNRHSPAVLVDCDDFSMLFTGDMGKEDEALLCGRLDGRNGITVLKAGHHGSRGSSSGALLEAASPEAAVISCGRKNRYSHPHEETLQRMESRGISYFVTASEGALEIDEKHIYGMR